METTCVAYLVARVAISAPMARKMARNGSALDNALAPGASNMTLRYPYTYVG